VQFNLTGEGGGTWTFKIAEGKCEVKDGAAESPMATLTATAADYLAIVRGELNAVSAFMSGKIKVTGDLGIMMKFHSWFM
jgi:putative sterol carrier protein